MKRLTLKARIVKQQWHYFVVVVGGGQFKEVSRDYVKCIFDGVI
ncbi:hypothetical protein [Vibrio cholerae]|nr:hypothetical protein [Vibrio cholerae]KFE28078.1 hypothetical protein DN30_1191 [Vibrio cholerae]GHW90019.1 hypothetical protein VCSRO105_0622 [Vibrio cholerae]